MDMEVTCSKGTYIRTLCQDIGERLGCGGCMESLLRTKVDRFELSDALRLSQVEALRDEGLLDSHILSIDEMFEKDQKVIVREEGLKLLMNGNQLDRALFIDAQSVKDGERVRVYDSLGRFYALYRSEEKRRCFELVKMFFDREDA